ncbi:alcohol dehydrogenase [Pseudomonas oryzihabitans]|uniref:zinc-dependent alcohol dehydrogenase family protein n=1 Tax=Pseudomonas rhizoryzae TaxID=2571129 RepID=UPI0007371B6F|nr:NAD(P)-dependent alcohol dehydrogenase [Pseudomonas rhizoryzae]KTS77024.1 alcohol dehydrogenase [Pseudomonas psychrotolerans]KTT30698.1 alcohol dehydrogenase [Pseudomonas psychrotolerans]KTT34281.1 alcohol dehydrogenase [Pseudomonas psychrotolerans]KTT67580.1 alcohol dehydrogenase [Pseudomonas psychrotolerans]KTT76940.1 alcohol dehydrogenase [Pseudomonas psychrotolerans]
MLPTSTRQWQLRDYGATNLELIEAPVPQPAPHEVLVRVAAVSLNYRDRLVLDNGMGSSLRFPFVPGSDLVGEVVAVGPAVSRVRLGQRVINTFWRDWLDAPLPGPTPDAAFGGADLPGVLSQYRVLHEDNLVMAPETLADGPASTLVCAGLTAWHSLVEVGRLQPGQWVLVQGSGGVALFAAQLALSLGAQVVLTSASAEKRERARALGVQQVVDRCRLDWPAQVWQATGGRGVDLVIELAGGDLGLSLDTLAPGGTLVVVGVLEGFQLQVPCATLFAKRARIQGVAVGNRRALEDLVRWIDRTGITPQVDAEYGLADLPAALDHLARGAFGKVVVRME